ncbi:hypothetical protein BDW22DRAFT_90814 [Trametopsis cervina]|nr:hypothetical protein BDW22DRAFT_90814 [Trametopsis cervina]
MRSRTPDRPPVLSNEKGPLWWCNSARRRGARSLESRGCVPQLPLLRASAGLSPSSGGRVHPHSAAQARRRAPRKISSVRPNRRSSPSTAQNPVARGPWGLVEDGAGGLISVCGGRWTHEQSTDHNFICEEVVHSDKHCNMLERRKGTYSACCPNAFELRISLSSAQKPISETASSNSAHVLPSPLFQPEIHSAIL